MKYRKSPVVPKIKAKHPRPSTMPAIDFAALLGFEVNNIIIARAIAYTESGSDKNEMMENKTIARQCFQCRAILF
jgi:hypothetical protein